MSPFAAPVSMIAASGKGGALAAALLALVLVLAYSKQPQSNASQATSHP